MRIEFAKYVERALEDPTTAEQMRLDLMGEWPRMLMREFAVELYRSVGYEVSWEYVDVYGEEEEEEEEEDSFESDEEEEEEEEHESEESEESENEDVEDDI
jgi:ABC-type Zn2+ transport system substrate-binding protein/surface adhesin